MPKNPRTLTVNILTLFPELVEIAFTQSILKRARMKGLFEPRVINIRDFSRDKHRTADDKPYGGGCGMVIKIEPIARALAAARRRGGTGKIFLLTPTGRKFDQAMARKLSQESQFTLICGRYEGIDQRVEDNFCDEAISIGDYVLTGGEPVAVVIIDAVVRLLPNVLGAKDSAVWDSFSDGLLDYPHYTRPPSYRNWRVPEVLLSGDHKKLTGWRREKQLETTLWNRPDLLQNASLSVSDLKVLDGLQKKAKKKQKTSRRIKS